MKKILLWLAIASDIALLLIVLYCSTGCSTKFVTTTTQTNFYNYPDTISWKVGKKTIQMQGSCEGKAYTYKKPAGDYHIENSEVSYRIPEANIYVKHYNK